MPGRLSSSDTPAVPATDGKRRGGLFNSCSHSHSMAYLSCWPLTASICMTDVRIAFKTINVMIHDRQAGWPHQMLRAQHEVLSCRPALSICISAVRAAYQTVDVTLCVGRLSSVSNPATPGMDGKRPGGLFNCCGRKTQPTTSPPEAQPNSATFR